MLHVETALKKFGNKGEKTGWTYIDIPVELAEALLPGARKSFRVRGTLNGHPIQGVALVPVGGGNFILAVNAALRKALQKTAGDVITAALEHDPELPKISALLLSCLDDEPAARSYFETLPRSHQLYFTRWIESAKGEETRTRRIALVVNAMVRKIDFGLLLQEEKNRRAGLR